MVTSMMQACRFLSIGLLVFYAMALIRAGSGVFFVVLFYWQKVKSPGG